MAEYYRDITDYGERRRKRRSAVGLFLDIIMTAVSACVAVMFAATLLAPALGPEVTGWVSTVGLVAPFVYAAQLLLTLYWIIRWRKAMMIPMAVLTVVALFHLSLFYKVAFRRSYGEPEYERSAVKVMTYNLRSFIGDDGKRCLDSIVACIRGFNPDILCIQESGFNDLADSLLEPLHALPHLLLRGSRDRDLRRTKVQGLHPRKLRHTPRRAGGHPQGDRGGSIAPRRGDLHLDGTLLETGQRAGELHAAHPAPRIHPRGVRPLRTRLFRLLPRRSHPARGRTRCPLLSTNGRAGAYNQCAYMAIKAYLSPKLV